MPMKKTKPPAPPDPVSCHDCKKTMNYICTIQRGEYSMQLRQCPKCKTVRAI